MRRHIIQLVLLALILTLFPVAPRTARAAVLNKAPNNLGLVNYWSFNDGNGTVANDASGNGNIGTLYSSPAWSSGKRGGALSFNKAVPNYVKSAGTLGAPANVTVSAWVKAADTAPSTYEYIVNQGRDNYCSGYALYLYSSTLYFNINTNSADDGCEASAPVAFADTGNWHHVVGTYDGTTAKTYIDGSLKNSSTASIAGNIVYKYSEVLNVAKMSYGEPTLYFPYSGLVDEVRIYNRALSGSEVSALYQAGSVKMISGATPSQISGLVGWWDAADADQVRSGSDCTGTVAGGGTIGCLKDKSAAGNNMTQPTVGTRPTYQVNIKNGNPVVRMASQTLYTSTNFPAPVTVMYVAHHTGGLNGRMLSAVNNNWLLGYWGGGKRQAYFEGWVSAAGSPSSDTGWNTYSAVIPGSGQNTLVYENGSQVFSNQGGVTGPNGLTLDGEYSEYSNGETGEVLVYNRALTDAERSSLERYLNNKWAVGYSGVARATDMGISSSRNSRLTSGLVGEWSFDGPDISGTTLYDRSGQGNNMTISGGQVTPGRIGQGYTFASSGDKAYTGSNAVLNTDTHTISFWIKFNTNSTYWGQILTYRPAGTDRSPGIWTYSGQNCIHWRYDPGNSGPTSCGGPGGESTYFNIGEWYHVVGVKNGGTFTFYVNGTQQEQGGVANPKTAGSAAIELGAPGSGYSAGIISLDDVRIYNRALSSTEVYQLYSLGK